MEKEKKETRVDVPRVEVYSVLYIVYVLYKTNVITNRRVGDILAFIKKDTPPDNLAEYLLKEAARAA